MIFGYSLRPALIGAGLLIASGSVCAADLSTEIARCWNIDPSSASAQVSVTVRFDRAETGRPDASSVALVGAYSSSGLYDENGQVTGEVRTAFDAARRAILRCRPDLSDEDETTFEMVFDPVKMRLR